MRRRFGVRGRHRCAALLTVAVAVVAGTGSAHAGGAPIGFVTLPADRILSIVQLPGGGTIARIRVPGRPSAVAASMNGHRVLVASPDTGTVSEIDGLHHRLLTVFHGFSRPVAVAFDYEPPVGIVTPRFAYVLEQARGTISVLDLARRRIVARLPVGHDPERLAVDGSTLWIAHTTSTALTRVDVATPSAPRLLQDVDPGRPVSALVADRDLRSTFVTFAGSALVARYLDEDGRVHRIYLANAGTAPLSGLAVAAPHLLIAAGRGGALHVLNEQNGQPRSRLPAPHGVEALDAYGGWLVAILPRRLDLVGVPDGSMRTSVPFASQIGGFAWAVT